jgi:hypothetical protein
MYRLFNSSSLGALAGAVLFLVQPACSPADYDIRVDLTQGKLDAPLNSDLCKQFPDAAACSRTPIASRPGVVTILFTMKWIPQGAAALILGNAIRYASPKANPKVLFLEDSNLWDEDVTDIELIREVLLAGFQVSFRKIPVGGLPESAALEEFDVVMVSNPGHPLQDLQTYLRLMAYSGGVVLLGDDMTRNIGEQSMQALTGLVSQSSGTSIQCPGSSTSLAYDGGSGNAYRVAIDQAFLEGVPEQYMAYTYANDVDHSQPQAGTEVLAWALPQANHCGGANLRWPAVVRKLR